MRPRDAPRAWAEVKGRWRVPLGLLRTFLTLALKLLHPRNPSVLSRPEWVVTLSAGPPLYFSSIAVTLVEANPGVNSPFPGVGLACPAKAAVPNRSSSQKLSSLFLRIILPSPETSACTGYPGGCSICQHPGPTHRQSESEGQGQCLNEGQGSA